FIAKSADLRFSRSVLLPCRLFARRPDGAATETGLSGGLAGKHFAHAQKRHDAGRNPTPAFPQKISHHLLFIRRMGFLAHHPFGTESRITYRPFSKASNAARTAFKSSHASTFFAGLRNK